MKHSASLLGVSAVLSLTLMCACSDKEDPENKTYDESYYAASATVTSDSSNFTQTSSGGTILFPASGGETVLNVSCGTDWTFSNPATDVFRTSSTSGSLTVSADQSMLKEEISYDITLMTSASHIVFATVTVVQSAYDDPGITASVTEWHAPAVGQLSVEIQVEANTDWEAKSSASWLGVEKTPDGLALTADENDTYNSKSATVLLTASDGLKSAELSIAVTQDPLAAISVEDGSVHFHEGAASASVAVDSNMDWDFTSDSSASWLQVSKDGDNLNVSVSALDGDGSRESAVTLTCGDGAENNAEFTLNVVQAPAADTALILEYTIKSGKTEIYLPITGTVDCLVDWGDGGALERAVNSLPTHTYARSGTYDISVEGTATEISHYGVPSSSATLVTAVVQWGLTGLTSMDYAFGNCSSLQSIPGDTLGAFSEVTSFNNAFRYCTALTSVGEGLFDYAAKATDMKLCFYHCDTLPSVPEGLFDNCTEVETLHGCFECDYALESIPDGLFDACVKNTSFQAIFYDCRSLTSIPAGIFSKCPEVESFQHAFYDCTGITSVPSGLFSNNLKATSFFGVFRSCSALTSLPAGLFSGCSEATTFDYVFANCSSLTTVPEDTFSGCTKAEEFKYAFYQCTGLTSIPALLFADSKLVLSFFYAFYECTKVSGESPYNILEINGKEVKVHLYQRQDSAYVDYFTTTDTASYGCYRDCTKLSDYSSIPLSWK